MDGLVRTFRGGGPYRARDRRRSRRVVLTAEVASYLNLRGGGVLPILRCTCMCRANAPVFGHFSLSVRRKNVNFLSLCPN